MRAGRFISAGLAAFCFLPPALAQEIHFSPEERLDAIDAALIATARSSIDLASYALTDPIVLDALNAAERRGVVIRVVLDPREHHDSGRREQERRRGAAAAARVPGSPVGRIGEHGDAGCAVMSEVGEVVVFETLHQTPRGVVGGRQVERGGDRVKLELGALPAPPTSSGNAVKVMRIATGEETEDYRGDGEKDVAAKALGRKGALRARQKCSSPR